MSLYRGVQNAAKLQRGILSGSLLTIKSQHASKRFLTVPSSIPQRQCFPSILPASRRCLSLFSWTRKGNATPAEHASNTVDKSVSPSPTLADNGPVTSSLSQIDGSAVSSSSSTDNQVAASIIPTENATQHPGILDLSSVDPSLLSTADLSTISSSVVVPMHIGDMHAMGLANFTPVGAIQMAFEFIHVTTGMPWWASIVTVTLLLRMVGFHFTVTSLRASSNLTPIRPKIEKLAKEAQEAAASGDLLKRQTAVIEMRTLQKDAGVSFWKLMQGPAYQVVVSICGFIATKKACDLPVPQLQAEGFLWIPSLTGADPYVVLPVLSAAVAILQNRLSIPEMKATGSPISMHMPNVVPFLALLSLAVFYKFPAAVVLSVVTNVTFMTAQAAILRRPRVRLALNLNPLPSVSRAELPTMRQTWNALINFFKQRHTQALADQQRKLQQRPHFPAHNVRGSTQSVMKGQKKNY